MYLSGTTSRPGPCPQCQGDRLPFTTQQGHQRWRCHPCYNTYHRNYQRELRAGKLPPLVSLPDWNTARTDT